MNTFKVNKFGHLEIGGLDAVEIVKNYPTPVYVMEDDHIRLMLSTFKTALEKNYGYGGISYASKAFSCKEMYRILKSLGIFADVVSIGEIMTAIRAGFPPENLYFHGNNKAVFEISSAIEHGVGYFCIDSFDEIEILGKIAKDKNVVQKVLLRINPAVTAGANKCVQTGASDSKFGFSIKFGVADKALEKVFQTKNLEFVGINCHIGSQIFDKKAFGLAISVMTDYMKQIAERGIMTKILDLGGGFGVRYTDADPDLSLDDYAEFVKYIADELTKAVDLKRLKKPFLLLEPGRSVVCGAGTTLYTVGTVKEISNGVGTVKKYVAVDGSLADNPRPIMYNSKYTAVIANKMLANSPMPVETVSIVGRCCETDLLIEDIKLPVAKRGDIIAVLGTGAYNYSMSGNYNRLPKPGVLLVKDGRAEYIVKPETIADMYRNDL